MLTISPSAYSVDCNVGCERQRSGVAIGLSRRAAPNASATYQRETYRLRSRYGSCANSMWANRVNENEQDEQLRSWRASLQRNRHQEGTPALNAGVTVAFFSPWGRIGITPPPSRTCEAVERRMPTCVCQLSLVLTVCVLTLHGDKRPTLLLSRGDTVEMAESIR